MTYWTFWLLGKLVMWCYIHLNRAWLLSSSSLPSWQVNMVDWLWTVVEWSFHLFERDHSKSRIFERMEKFQNDCSHPWTKNLFKNSCSRQLRFGNAVVALITSGSDRLTEIYFSSLQSYTFLGQVVTITVNEDNNDKTYWMNVFFVVFWLFVLLPNLMSKLIHNWCLWKLSIKFAAVYVLAQEKSRLCFCVLVCYFVVLDIHLWQLY